ncbi:MAG: 5'-nucleotidase C-terminal domain-containing protein [Oceanihabitans sp.]
MNYKHLFVLFCLLFLSTCKQKNNLQLTKIEGKQINISDSIKIDPEIDAIIKPYREHVNKNLDSVIAYAPATYSKKDGTFNTAIGNLFADAVWSQSNPVFNSRTNKNIDMVLLNHGGIRAIISKGNITPRTAYKIMPFENSVVVAAMKGKTITDSLVRYLQKAKKAHPISGLNITLDSNFNLIKATINNKEIEANKTYYVATNDYLYNGGDNMSFFKTNDSLYSLNYKIRNALLDYFIKKDTINPVIDNRFIQTK